jgi:hypothetical protein
MLPLLAKASHDPMLSQRLWNAPVGLWRTGPGMGRVPASFHQEGTL